MSSTLNANDREELKAALRRLLTWLDQVDSPTVVYSLAQEREKKAEAALQTAKEDIEIEKEKLAMLARQVLEEVGHLGPSVSGTAEDDIWEAVVVAHERLVDAENARDSARRALRESLEALAEIDAAWDEQCDGPGSDERQYAAVVRTRSVLSRLATFDTSVPEDRARYRAPLSSVMADDDAQVSIEIAKTDGVHRQFPDEGDTE